MSKENLETHVYQHKVPQVYMKYWKYSDDKEVYIYEKEKVFNFLRECKLKGNIDDMKKMFVGKSCSISEIGGENDFYTIFEYSLICTAKDIQRIESGEYRILDIEKGWHELENKWTSLVSNIINNTNTNKFLIGEFKKKEIISFVIIMFFRGDKGVDKFKKILIDLLSDENTNISDSDRNIAITAIENIEEIPKDALLGEMRKLFDGDGYIHKLCEIFTDNFTILFSKAPNNIEFITSDNPSLISEIVIRDKDEKIKTKGKILTMPITPKIRIDILLNEKGNKKYKNVTVQNHEVRNFNQMMLENSKKYIISNSDNIFDFIVQY